MKFSKRLGEKLDAYLEYGARFKSAAASKYFYMTMVIPLTLLFFIIVLLISRWDSNMLWIKSKMSPNKIIVKQLGLKESDNITIKWTCGDYCDTIIIFDNNKIINKDFKNSGDNIFLVYLNDSLIYKKEQYKSINWQGYNYYFNIRKNKEEFLTELTIER